MTRRFNSANTKAGHWTRYEASSATSHIHCLKIHCNDTTHLNIILAVMDATSLSKNFEASTGLR
jgi:hypothetical protein